MYSVQITLLGTPEIYMDGRQITFALKKADALFFYMLMEKHATRTQLATLLWGGQSDSTSRKNLRNALYYIKKGLGFDPFVSPKKQILNLNPEIEFLVDVDEFLETRNLRLYQENFLHGFALKDSYEYDEWMNNWRSRLLDLYLQESYQYFHLIPENQIQEREKIFHLYINKDPLDERIYMNMMETYYHQKQYLKGIKCYESLVNTLRQELNLPPSLDAQQLYRVLIQEWNENSQPAPASSTKEITPVLFGRTREWNVLQRNYQQLLQGQGSCIFLTGESGIGKSYLCHHFLDQLDRDSVLILRNSCFDQEKTLPLYVWNNLLMQLEKKCQNLNLDLGPQLLKSIHPLFPMLESFTVSDDLPQDITGTYNYRTVRNTVLRLITRISETLPIVLFLDDIQNMDEMSMEWLSALIRQNNKEMMILCTCPQHLDTYNDHLIHTLVCYRNVQKLTLERFTWEDTRRIVQQTHAHVTDEEIQRIYEQCQGNAFFLNLLLEHLEERDENEQLPHRAQDMLTSKLIRLSKEERLILEMISLFPDYTTLDLLESVTEQNSMQLLDGLDHLIRQDLLLEENVHEQSRFRFVYPQMRDFVLNQISPSRIRVYHLRVARYLEDLPSPKTIRRYAQLIEHYSLAGLSAKSLYYRICRLEAHANRSYDLYPLLSTGTDDSFSSMDEIFRQLFTMKEELSDLYQLVPEQIDYTEAEARLCLTIGKTCIQQGRYKEGLEHIRSILANNSYVQSHPTFLRACYRQFIFYGIQTDDLEEMRKALEQCEAIDGPLNEVSEQAIDHRLRGLYYLKAGDHDKAEQELNLAIDTFRSIPLQMTTYTVNLAACYNYLGQLAVAQENYLKGIHLFQEAIRMCRDKGSMENPTFYSNLADAFLRMKSWSKAYDAASHGAQLYENSPTCMGRAQCYCCCSYLAYHNGDIRTCKSYLELAKRAAEKLDSPTDRQYCLDLMKRIKRNEMDP